MPKKYGINESQYQELFKQQNGKCAICGETETRKNKQGNLWNLPIDHDHKTKKIRGLLCHRCNLVLGFVKDNPTLLQEMIKYLNKNGKKKIQN